MNAADFFATISKNAITLMDGFFAWYNSVSRSILDVFHSVFDNIFNALLLIAILLSLLYLFMSAHASFRRKKSAKEASKLTGDVPFVTVQIPTFNELAAIRCAKSCLGFDYPSDRYEIIIGDDSNKPEVSMKLKEFARMHENIKLVKRNTNSGYKPGNLNNMLKHTKGEIIVIFDSDFVPPRDFISRIVQPFMWDEKVAGVQARWKLINPNQNFISILGATIVLTFHHIALPFVYSKRRITFLCGSAEAVRKSTLVELGGWENGNLTEDIEYSLRLLEKGYRLEYLDSLECEGEVPYTIKDLYRQQMRWAYGVIYSWKKHFRMLNKSKNLSIGDKIYMQGIFLSGYLLSILLAGLFITGTLSLITHAPEPVKWGEFTLKMATNITLTSGLIVASIVALHKARQSKLTSKMLVSSFSYGLIVTYYVNVGIIKAMLKMPMEWYMLNKKGNEVYSQDLSCKVF